MKYAFPENVPHCNCLHQGAAPIFCPTGHLLECHFPLNCRDAACSHLDRYEEVTPEARERLDTEGRAILAGLADPNCQDCSGKGLLQVQFTPDIAIPESMAHLFPGGLVLTADAVCHCISRPLQDVISLN